MTQIIQYLKKVPAGIMIIPLFLAALLHTFFPEWLEIGSFTTATFSNEAAATIMGVQLVCLGSRLKFKEVPKIAKRGGILLFTRFAIGAMVGIAMGSVFGLDGIWGLSTLAIITAMTNCNGSIYLSLMAVYGDDTDAAAVTLLSISNGPLFTLIVLGMAGFAQISALSLFATIVPILVGMVLGNMSEDFRRFLEPGISLLLPFIGFSLGAGIDLKGIIQGGAAGFVLGFMVIVICGSLMTLSDRMLIRRPGYAGLAASSTGANAVAVPAAVALIDPSWEPFVEQATTQVAAAVVLSAIFIPLLTGKWAAYINKKHQ